MVDPNDSEKYIWRESGKQIADNDQYWIDESDREKPGKRIVYMSKGSSFGWSLTTEVTPHSYICKIPKSEVYRIKQRTRDFNFGAGVIDAWDIKRGPNMTIESPNYIVLEGLETTSLECVATGNPAVQYKWYRLDEKIIQSGEGITKSGTEIASSSRYTLTNGRLTISQPQAAFDEGYFQCSAENDFGRVLGNPVQITFGRLGEFSNVRPEAVHVKAYEFAILICSEIRYKPPPKAKWGPTILNDFILVNPSPPMLGHNVRLECFAVGSQTDAEPMTYDWRKIDGELANNIKFSDLNRVLTIENSRFENEGVYRCIVMRGKSGRDEKDFALLLSAKPYFVLPLKPQHIDVGSHLTWRCDARGRPKVTYSWYKNGVLINEKRDNVKIQGNMLIINAADKDLHSGMYQCGASNTFGITFSGAQLRVLAFKPTFIRSHQSKTMSGALMGNVSLICDPESAPEAVITWSKDGAELNLDVSANENDHLRLLANGNLFLNNINDNDAGEYTCKASNTLGETTFTIQFRVTDQIVIAYPPINTEVIVNETAFIPCDVSHPYFVDLVFHWLFNGKPLNLENNPHYSTSEVNGHIRGLYIRDAKVYQQGQYECIAITPTHKVSAGAYLTVKGPPFPPSGVSVALYSGTTTTLTLQWLAPYDGGSPILFYMILAKHNYENDWKILTESLKEPSTLKENTNMKFANMEGLIPNATYSFRVRAINIYGVGENSHPSRFHKMDPSNPQAAPKLVGGGGGKVGQLHISWEALLPTEQGGKGIGYNVYWRRTSDKYLRWKKHVIHKDADELFLLVGAENFYIKYEVKVQAFNLYGDGPNSTVVEVYSAEGMPTVVPDNVNVVTYNGTAVTVLWTPVPDTHADMKGVVQGYQVNYFDRDIENAPTYFQSFFGQMSSAMIIGLKPNGYYWMTVQVFNTAGLSDLSEKYLGKTGSDPPLKYPIEIHVYSHGPESVRVTFRGVGYNNNEDPIQGYKLCSWQVTDMMDYSKCVQVGVVSSGIIPNLKKNVLYKLRVCGFTGAGDGKLSELTYFTLGGLVKYNPQDFEVLAISSTIHANFGIILILYIITIYSPNNIFT
ncbi:contactincontactin-like [Octopus vulgaris]|uniref:Contactincontactin-like n=1 Tax=Octopus vulgaris TaxID=6645 RepID=A0AA36B087_OCTVU|nr:contactincontactin-like [Octopus vulgaris]